MMYELLVIAGVFALCAIGLIVLALVRRGI